MNRRNYSQARNVDCDQQISLLANGALREGSGRADGLRVTTRLGVGVHLNLSADGKPVAASPERVRSLLDENGDFSGGPKALLFRLTAKSLETKEVEAEWNAQIEKVRAAGIHPIHLDGHKHVHMLPGLFAVALVSAFQEAWGSSFFASGARSVESGGLR